MCRIASLTESGGRGRRLSEAREEKGIGGKVKVVGQ
jgi:hypothetical protein